MERGIFDEFSIGKKGIENPEKSGPGAKYDAQGGGSPRAGYGAGGFGGAPFIPFYTHHISHTYPFIIYIIYYMYHIYVRYHIYHIYDISYIYIIHRTEKTQPWHAIRGSAVADISTDRYYYQSTKKELADIIRTVTVSVQILSGEIRQWQSSRMPQPIARRRAERGGGYSF